MGTFDLIEIMNTTLMWLLKLYKLSSNDSHSFVNFM